MLRYSEYSKDELELVSAGGGYCVYPIEGGNWRNIAVLANYYDNGGVLPVLKTVDVTSSLNDLGDDTVRQCVKDINLNKNLLSLSPYSVLKTFVFFAHVVIPCNQNDFVSLTLVYLD